MHLKGLFLAIALLLHGSQLDAVTFSIRKGRNETIIVIDSTNRASNLLLWSSCILFGVVLSGLFVMWLKARSESKAAKEFKDLNPLKNIKEEDDQRGAKSPIRTGITRCGQRGAALFSTTHDEEV